MGGASPYSFQSVLMVRTQCGQMEIDLLDFALRQHFEILLRQLAESQIVSQTAGRIAGAALLLEHAERDAQVPHHLGQ